MNLTIGYALSNGLGKFINDIRRCLVINRVHGIKAQPVEMELLQPIEGIVYDKISHQPAAGPGEVDGRTPWRVVAVSEEIRGNNRQIISLGTKMIIDDI